MFMEDDEEVGWSIYDGQAEDPQLSNALASHIFWELKQLGTIPDKAVQDQIKNLNPKRTEILKNPLDFYYDISKTNPSQFIRI